ncbi:MAG: iron ABC transporter [Rhizobiales bacterium 12-68-15]|nr:MAG: iron ABC transporter [Rhizobiales bacterium 12-68-15]
MSRTPPLSLTNVSVSYGRRPVVRDLTLAPLPGGRVTALVGPNAAGKSTLLRAIAGLLPARGRLELGGVDLSTLSRTARAARIGFMPQALPQGVALTVMETVMGALRAAPLPVPLSGAQVEMRAAETLETLGMDGLALEPLDRLSGGQRQLASLAQALVRRPEVLLLDEPTSALDLRHQALVMAILRRLADEGRLVVTVLHDLALAARHADHIVVLSHGACAAEGPPAGTLTADLLARVYGVEGRVETCSRGTVQIVVDGPAAGWPRMRGET